MKEIDFTVFLGSDKVSDYISFVKHQLQLLKRFKSYKFLLNERMMNFDFSEIEVNEKQLEIFEFKIEKEENLFCFFYFEYEKLKTFSYEEKIITSIELFFDTIWKTSLSSFQIFRLQNRFLDDYKEFLLIAKKDSPIDENDAIDENEVDSSINSLNTSLTLKDIFIDKKLFEKIDFDLIKTFDAVYKSDCKNLEYNRRFKSDLIILFILLQEKKIIKKTTQKYLNEILNEVLQQNRDSTTLINDIFTKNSNEKLRNPYDKRAYINISLFIGHFTS